MDFSIMQVVFQDPAYPIEFLDLISFWYLDPKPTYEIKCRFVYPALHPRCSMHGSDMHPTIADQRVLVQVGPLFLDSNLLWPPLTYIALLGTFFLNLKRTIEIARKKTWATWF